jgi:hypothetical protein
LRKREIIIYLGGPEETGNFIGEAKEKGRDVYVVLYIFMGGLIFVFILATL